MSLEASHLQRAASPASSARLSLINPRLQHEAGDGIFLRPPSYLEDLLTIKSSVLQEGQELPPICFSCRASTVTVRYNSARVGRLYLLPCQTAEGRTVLGSQYLNTNLCKLCRRYSTGLPTSQKFHTNLWSQGVWHNVSIQPCPQEFIKRL